MLNEELSEDELELITGDADSYLVQIENEIEKINKQLENENLTQEDKKYLKDKLEHYKDELNNKIPINYSTISR